MLGKNINFSSEEDKRLYSLLTNSQAKILFVTHNRGGGVEKHIKELIEILPDNIEPIILRPSYDGSKCVVIEFAEQLQLYFDYHSDISDLYEFFFKINLVHVHIHHIKGFNQEVLKLLKNLELPWDITIHDYYLICPQITLIDNQAEYCLEKGVDSCQECLNYRPAPGGISITEWRERNEWLVKDAERCFVPSQDVFSRMSFYYPVANYIIVYHEELETIKTDVRNTKATKINHLRVLVIGALTPMKGANLLELTAINAKKRNLPINFILIGDSYRKLICKPSSNLEILGRYNDNELQGLIESTCPDVVWFTALWPETYSYTLSAALQAQLPIVVPNIGAFQERLFNRNMSWIVPWNLNEDEFNTFFMLLRDRMCLLRNDDFDSRYRSTISPASKVFDYKNNYIEYNKKKNLIKQLDVEEYYLKLKRRLKPPHNLSSFFKNSLLNVLNKLRRMSIFSGVVKLIPQSLQTRIKGWMLGESD